MGNSNRPQICPACGLRLRSAAARCSRCEREAAISPPAPPPNPGLPAQLEGDCPHCGRHLPQFQPLCPNCGASVTPRQGVIWPPPAIGYLAPPLPISKLITGSEAWDAVLGFVFVFASLLLYGIGLVAAPVAYVSARLTYRFFALGVGYGMAAVGVVLLGAFVWCLRGFHGFY